MKTSVQQLMIGPLCKSYDKTINVLKDIKNMGYDAIELNGFMIHKTPLIVRIITSLAGMPVGKGGKYNWPLLIKESGLEVSALHSDLDSLEKALDKVINEAKSFNTHYLVLTGVYQFDYSKREQVSALANRLNIIGKKIKEEGLELLYHNHNVEFVKIDGKITAYDLLIKELNGEYVNFEFDSYWAIDAGADVYSLMRKLGSRIKIHHINDRGFKKKGPYVTPIIKCDSMELGTGNVDIQSLLKIDLNNKTEFVTLESHKNFIDHSRIKSIEISGKYLFETVKNNKL